MLGLPNLYCPVFFTPLRLKNAEKKKGLLTQAFYQLPGLPPLVP